MELHARQRTADQLDQAQVATLDGGSARATNSYNPAGLLTINKPNGVQLKMGRTAAPKAAPSLDFKMN